MYKSIAIFPQDNTKEYIQKCEDYISLAKQYGFNEIFTTLHLPEISFEKQLDTLLEVCELAKKFDMEVTSDIGGNYIKQLLINEELLNKLKKTKLDFLRLDYGYNHEDIKSLANKLPLKGFVINASIYNEIESKIEVEFIRSLNLEVRACHNYYPRIETGIDEELVLKQKQIFNSLNVPIYYCVANLNNPRGPIYKGLPSLEKHRYAPIDNVLLELIEKYEADGIMYADQFYEKEDFILLQEIENKIINIKVKLINNKYNNKVLIDHHFRYDSNEYILRSQTSRQMAEFAEVVEKENQIVRKRGSITIDNKDYGRYSSEIQIVLKDLPQDERVNVIGNIEEIELEKFAYYRKGYLYRLKND